MPPPVWTDLSLKKVVSIIYLFFACVWLMGAIFQNPSPSVTLKTRSRSPKSNQFLSLSQQFSCTSFVKIHPFILEIGCRQAISKNLRPLPPPLPWKWGQCHQNLISSCPYLNNIAVQVWLKSVHSFWEKGAEKPFSNNLSPPVTLKTGSRSPKSNQFFFMSQQYSCESLVKIHLFLHETGCRQAIFQQSKPLCGLENGVKVTKI